MYLFSQTNITNFGLKRKSVGNNIVFTIEVMQAVLIFI